MYLADAELWVWSEQVKELESIQLYIIRCDDIQVRQRGRRGKGRRRRDKEVGGGGGKGEEEG